MRTGWITGFVATTLGAAPFAQAQDEASSPQGWTVKSNFGLALTQSSFSQSWAGDEVGIVSWAGTLNSEAARQVTGWSHWMNTLVLQFGQTHQQDANRDQWLAPRKSADKITYRGALRLTLNQWVDPFVAFDADSQFFQEIAQGRRLLTPTVLTESFGVARPFIDTKERRLVSRFGFALKERIDRLAAPSVINTSTTLDDFDTESTVEGGFELFNQGRLAFEEERTVYTSELRFFKPVATSQDKPALRNHWPAIDIDWQNTLSNKVTKWMSFDLYWQLLYDKQVDLRGQFKQTLGFGFTAQLI